MADDQGGGWWWCLTHRRVERTAECRAEERLGPYETPEAARRWRERNESRTLRWEEEDERWAEWGEQDDADGAPQ